MLSVTKKTTLTGFYQIEKSDNAHNLDSMLPLPTMTIAKHSPQTDNAKNQCLDAAEWINFIIIQ